MRKVFFVTGTLILALSFLLLSCGSIGDPMIKALAQLGIYAVEIPIDQDISGDGNDDKPYINARTGVNTDRDGNVTGVNLTLYNSNITIEAWVKAVWDSDSGAYSISGPVVARGDGSGIALLISNDEAIVSTGNVGEQTSSQINDAEGNYFADGNWHHVAGVLAVEAHNHTVTDADNDDDNTDTGTNEGGTCSTQDMAGIHIDIYVDGVWQDCDNASFSERVESAISDITTYPIDSCIHKECVLDTDDSDGDGSTTDYKTEPEQYWGDCSTTIGRNLGGVGGSDVTFVGVIDEVRLWKEARTAEQIEAWRHTTITADNWSSANPLNSLIGYWKFNEGSGKTAMDSSGFGNSASKLKCTDKKVLDDKGTEDTSDDEYVIACGKSMTECYDDGSNDGEANEPWEYGWTEGVM